MNLKARCFNTAVGLLENAKNNLQQIKRTVKAYSPTTILNKGYAIVMQEDRIIIDPKDISPEMGLKTVLKNQVVHSIFTKITNNEIDL